jgi:hypothetical protein
MGMLDRFDWRKFGNALATMPTVQALKSGFTYPGDIASGKESFNIPSQNPDMSRAADVMGFMGGGSVVSRAAGQIPKNAIGTFGGPFSKTAPIKDFQAAAKLERKGASPIDIWHERQIFRDPMGNWNYEIPNRQHTFEPPAGKREDLGRLREYMQAPELEKAYPGILNTPTITNPRKKYAQGQYGVFEPGDPGVIRVEGPPKTMRETAIHEIEHAVQNRERRFGVGEKGSSHMDKLEYYTDPAEVMARAAQNRRDMTPDQLRELHPLRTPEQPFLEKFFDEIQRKKGQDAVMTGLLSRQPGGGWL